jgi:NAD(P)-dependent dehydrogenase (short-subunit alcohol dehydrogenase family)
MKSRSKLLIVIGGGRGIGAAVVRCAVKNNYDVVIGYRSSKTIAEQLVIELSGSKKKLYARPIEVSDPIDVENFFLEIEKSIGIPDSIVFAAGISGSRAKLLDTKYEDIARIINVNLLGAFNVLKSAVPAMIKSDREAGRSIVIISSEAAKFGGMNISPYAASKAGLNAMVIGLAREFAPDGIRINAVSPGIINTGEYGKELNPDQNSLLSTIPLGRVGDTNEVAEAIIWLLSDKSSYVAGSILSVAGGR